jgi:hypothetical protein
VSRAVRAVALVLALAAALAGLEAGPAAGDALIPTEEISVSGETLPQLLPRGKPIPVGLGIGFTSEDTATRTAPELTQISFDISRNVTVDTTGLPRCTLAELFESYEGGEPCPGSLVGTGTVISEITVPGHPTARAAEGTLYAYYGFVGGSPHILARIAVNEPLPLIYVIPFAIKQGEGVYGTTLVANKMRIRKGICRRDRPNCFAQPYNFKGIYGHISSFRLFLQRRFRSRGRRRSIVSASCPPDGRSPRFALERMSLRFASGSVGLGVVTGRCKPPG